MTTRERVIRASEVSIDGQFYKTTRPVQTQLFSQFAGKVVIGDTTADSRQRLSVIRWDNAQGGIGKKDHQGATDVGRLWYGTSHLRVNGHRTLPDRVTTTAASGVPGVITVDAIQELANTVYTAFGNSIRSYTFNSDTWGSNLHTLAGTVSDSLSGRLGGTVYMVFFYSSGYVYTTDGSSFTASTVDVEYGTIWDDRIWGIDATGQLRWAFNPTGDWTDDAQLPLPNGYVQDLFVGRDAIGNFILYASTKVGLFAHDAGNNQFVETDMDLPFQDEAGRDTDRFRGNTYIPAGLGIYKYAIGGAGAVITTNGPDKDQGLPSDRRGTIVGLHKTQNDLVAMVDSSSSTAEASDTWPSAGLSSHLSPAINIATGISLVLGWNELGWQVLFESATGTEAITTALVSNAYSGYRFWFGHNRRVKYFTLPVDIVNPSEITDRSYADSSRDESPWFDAGQAEVDKLGVRLLVEVADASASEHVTVFYGTDFDDDTWTQLTDAHTSDSSFDADDDRIEGDGVTVFSFPAVATPSGLEFRSFRWRTDLANGSDNSLSPDIRSIELEYRKKVAATFGWNLELDLKKKYKGRSAKEQRANLLASMRKNSLVEFTFRDDSGNTRNTYVDIIQMTASENTGHTEKGVTRVVVAEP
jgi:hypothetical protein